MVVFAVRQLCVPLEAPYWGRRQDAPNDKTFRQMLVEHPRAVLRRVGTKFYDLIGRRGTEAVREALTTTCRSLRPSSIMVNSTRLVWGQSSALSSDPRLRRERHGTQLKRYQGGASAPPLSFALVPPDFRKHTSARRAPLRGPSPNRCVERIPVDGFQFLALCRLIRIVHKQRS